MAEHFFCPMCGVAHGGDPVAEELAEPAQIDIGEPEGEDPEVAVAAIEAVAEVAEAALATVTELHAQEEETERLEVVEDAETDRTEIVAEVLTDAIEEEPGEPEVNEEPEENEEPEGAEETGEPIAVAPPPREEAAQGGKSSVRQQSAFSARHRH